MKFITSLILSVVSFCSLYSQNVYFPDPVFEARLLSSSPANTVAKNLQGNFFAIDANADGAIQVSEALQVSALNISSHYLYLITSIEGIEAFTNLTYLDCSNNNQIEYIELRNFPYLTYVDVVPANALKKLVITDNPQLTEINFTCVNCAYFLDALDTLDCSRNSLTALDLSSNGSWGGVPPMHYLDFSDNHISSFDFESSGVEYLDASGNDFTRMDIDIYNLETLIIDDNPLTYLRLYHTRLDTVIIQNFPDLDTLKVIGHADNHSNKAKYIELINLPSLEYVDCSFNLMQQLTLSNLPSLSDFDINGMDISLTLHNLPGMTNLEALKLKEVNRLSISELENLHEIRIMRSYQQSYIFSELAISDMDNLSVISVHLETDNFSISNAPHLDTVFYRNLWNLTPTLNFSNLPGLKYLELYANTADSTVHLSNLPLLSSFIAREGAIASLNFDDLPALADVDISGPELRFLNLQNLPGLKRVEIDAYKLRDLELVNLPLEVFKYTSSYYNTGRTLTFENLPQLDSIELKNIGIEVLHFTNLPQLHDLKVEHCRWLNSFTLNNLPELHSLDLSYIWLDTLVIADFPNLNQVKLHNINYNADEFSVLSAFEINNLPNLEYMSITEDQNIIVLPFNIVGFPKLKTLKYSLIGVYLTIADLPLLANLSLEIGCPDDTFVLSGFPSLQKLYCDLSGSSDQYVQITNMPMLEDVKLILRNREVDMSGCPSLDILDLDLWRPLNFLNLKNGNNSISTVNTNKAINNICVDDQSEADLIKTLDPELVNSVYTTDCEANLCELNRICGTVLYNLNNDACTGSGVPCDNTRITIEGDNAFTTFTDSAGRFEFITQSLNQNFIITPHFNKEYYHADPLSAMVTFTTYGNEFDTVFCVSSDESHNDMEIITSSGDRTRPGFDFSCYVDYTNNGTASGDGVVNLYFDDELMDVVSVEPGYDNYTSNCLSWNFTDLAPFENRGVMVTFNLNTPQDNPPLNGGEVLDFKAEILPVEADENPDDNTSTLRQLVVNSYDPNDKTCLEGDAINIQKVGDYVHYLIRFENKGTAEASFVRVKDVIDTLKFDINSFAIMNSSHTLECKITGGNEIEFLFNNIDLSNQPGENDGFVCFKIKTRSDLQMNDIFLNQALIYFDYNAPIYTNECETIILLNVNAEGSILPQSDVRVFPNPADELINISTKHPIQQIDILDLNGRLIKSFSGTTTIHLGDLKNGLYFIRVKQKTGVTVVKILKV